MVARTRPSRRSHRARSNYAAMLANDEDERRDGTGSEPIFQSVAEQLNAAGIEYQTPFAVGATPEAGLSDREIIKREGTLEYQLAIVPPLRDFGTNCNASRNVRA